MVDVRTDAELLRALRDGDKRAYAALWERHSPAAQRYAQRLTSARADDLVSESFLAIYQQVTTTDAGPQFAFRSYLKTVMRNTAIRWSKDADQLILTDELDAVDERDALSIAETDSDAGDVLTALQALPERWQRVLWLAEVAEAGRPEIARELQIKPNAVSALQRRARTGLKFQWLTLQVPPALRDDESHAARLFPQYLTEPTNVAISTEVNLHIADCTPCRALLHDTRGAASRMGGSTLAVLLGTAGIGTATATLSSATTATAIAVAVGAGAGAVTWLIGGGVAAVTAGGLVITSLFTVGPAAAMPEPAPTQVLVQASPSVPPPLIPAVGDSSQPPGPSTPVAAPGQVDPADQGISDRYTLEYQPRPSPASNVPDPAPTSEPGTPADPSATPGPTPTPTATPTPTTGTPVPSPGVTTPASTSGYISPIIAGKTAPGANVAVQLDTRRFTPTVAADGSWTFDTRGLELTAGDYRYQTWAYTGTTSSPATQGTFTVLPIQVRGFEDITGFEDLTADEARTTGLIVEFQGPANGTIYVSTMEGHTGFVALDANGYAKRRLLVNSYGWYWFTMRYIDGDGYWGPIWEHNLDVYDPTSVYDPMGPNPDDMTFQFVVP
ncbi:MULTISPECIES: RNA polymerase sigma factor [unclassified Microbacterium]|uniref:RNA polymerase sigma factor n=1 Tax=unclassified Microbacterium TaxID=2609290 RepID=UPI00364F176A